MTWNLKSTTLQLLKRDYWLFVTRFKATSARQTSQFILTKFEDGVGLVKVNKDGGLVEKENVLKDKNQNIK
ncbi:hypothetical protein [Psychroserpens jangbogonensis]|uniref:hypothetical protein n=1 Tax=Psychroserpens jangbogonensis TaxID=1484460 RepID=UPI00053E9A95|nr:hypothetical protein [Psychroserpens jangbogonensis]